MLLRSIVQARTIAAAPRLPLPAAAQPAFSRSIHSSLPAFKKKSSRSSSSSALEIEDEGAFEEDNFDLDLDTPSSSSTSPSSSTRASNAPSHSERWSTLLSSLTTSLSTDSAHHLPSFTPSSKNLIWLLSRVPPSSSSQESALSVLKDWRKHSLPIPSGAGRGFVLSSLKNGSPEVGAKVLKDREVYGIDLVEEDKGVVDSLLIALRDGEDKVEAWREVKDVARVREWHLGSPSIVGLVALIELSNSVVQQLRESSSTGEEIYLQTAEEALQTLKKLAGEQWTEALQELTKKNKSWMKDALGLLGLRLKQDGRDQDAMFFFEKTEGIRLPIKLESRKSSNGASAIL